MNNATKPSAPASVRETPAPPPKSVPARQPAASKSGLGMALAAVAAVGLGGAAWYFFSAESHSAKGDAKATAAGAPGDSAESATALPVKTTKMSKGGLTRTSTQIGSIHPFEQADLYAKVSGYLEKLNVNYGDRVKKGQVLAEIDDPEIVADAEKAAADVRQSKAAVTQAEVLIKVMEADEAAAKSAVQQAQAEVERFVSMTHYHSKKFERYRRLVESKAVPQEIADEEEESFESARSSEHAAKQAVLKSQADLVAATARIKKAESDLDEAKANVAVAEAQQARADAIRGYTTIHSPYDGVITKRNFFRGAFIRSASEGATMPLLTVARTDKVFVVTEVPDRDVPFTDVGDPVEITLDALGEVVLKGKVSRFAESEDPTSRTMHTEIDLPNPDNKIRAGMYGIAKIILGTSEKDSTLPASSLAGESKGGRADVLVVKDGKAKKVSVQIGADDGKRVEILSGLEPDDVVITNPNSVSDGVPVTAQQNEELASAAAPTAPDSKKPASAGHAPKPE